MKKITSKQISLLLEDKITYDELITFIKEWAAERGINNTKKEKAISQLFRLVEEFEKYSNALERNNYDDKNTIVDCIGNIQVSLIILCEQFDIDYKNALRKAIGAPVNPNTYADHYENIIEFSISKNQWFFTGDMRIELEKLSNQINDNSVAIMTIGKLQHIIISLAAHVAVNYKTALETWILKNMI